MPKNRGGYGGRGGGHGGDHGGGHGGGHGGSRKGCLVSEPSSVGPWGDCEDESPASAPKHVDRGGKMYSEEHMSLVRENLVLLNRQAQLVSELEELRVELRDTIKPIERPVVLASVELESLSKELQKASRDKFSADVDALKSEVENLKKWNDVLIVATGVACLMTVISFRVAYSACSRFNR